MGFGHWFSNAIKSAGHTVGSLVHLVEQNSGAITGALSAAGVSIDPKIISAVASIEHTVGSVVGPVTALANQAGAILQGSPLLQAARTMVPPTGVRGFDAAVAMMTQPGNEAAFTKARESLSGAEKQAFDTAVAAHIGQVAHPLPPAPPNVQAALAITTGLQGATADQKGGIVGTVAQTSAGAAGVQMALDRIDRNRISWWEKFCNFFSL